MTCTSGIRVLLLQTLVPRLLRCVCEVMGASLMPGAKSRLRRVAHTSAPRCEGAIVLEPGDLLIYLLSLLFSTVHISTCSTSPPWLIPTKEVGMFQIGANEIPDKKEWSRPLVLHLGQFCTPEDPWACMVVTTQGGKWY